MSTLLSHSIESSLKEGALGYLNAMCLDKNNSAIASVVYAIAARLFYDFLSEVAKKTTTYITHTDSKTALLITREPFALEAHIAVRRMLIPANLFFSTALAHMMASCIDSKISYTDIGKLELARLVEQWLWKI